MQGDSISHRKIGDGSRDSLHHNFLSVLDIYALAGLIGQALALEVVDGGVWFITFYATDACSILYFFYSAK